MVQAEHFRALLEIQGLDLKIKKHLTEIDSHKDRISSIKKERSNKSEQLITLKSRFEGIKNELSSNEKKLFQLEAQIAKSNDHIKMVTSSIQANALEKELNSIQVQKSETENIILELMDTSEGLEVEINDLNSFLEGSQSTLEEVTLEVEQDVGRENKEIKNYQTRIELLLESCPKEVFNLFSLKNKTYKYKNPLAFVADHACNQCGYAINRLLQSQIQRGDVLEECPGCGRILVPNLDNSVRSLESNKS